MVTTYQKKSIGVELATTFDSGAGEGGSEVVAHFDGRLYITDGAEDRVNVVDAATGELVFSIDLTVVPDYDGLNSVTVSASGIAVAIERDIDDFDNGVVARFSLDGTYIDAIEVGNLPDMVTFSKDGTMIFVANEGEPDGGTDPMGSISIIDVATGVAQTFDFTQFDAMAEELAEAGVRIFPDNMPSTDFEPEYIAEADGKLYVTLQEANTVAVFDLETMSWEALQPLGLADHSVDGNGIDPSDRDDAIDIHTVPVMGIRMPDAIAATEIDGQVYYFTANEGDDRGDFDEGGDAARVGDILDGDVPGLSIDPSVDTTGLERLTVSIIDGDTDGDGDIDVLHSYSSRSFSIFDAAGNLVFDSGDDFEQIIASIRPANAFNNDDFPSDDLDVVDDGRSDNKGPEAEAIAVGQVGDRTLAFIGLERDSGIMIYDVTNPSYSTFLDYIDGSEFGNVSPEVISFIAPEDSATGLAQIAVAYEISGTTSVYDLEFGARLVGDDTSEVIDGTLGDDNIKGKGGDDVIDAGGGNDGVNGGMGADSILGGAGDDTIFGGNGDDTIDGGLGDDLLVGQAGADVFAFGTGDGDDTIKGFGATDTIDLSETGLSFGDLVIDETPEGDVLVTYGTDSILVMLTGQNAVLDELSFQF
ncbi:choice-of-anchor I family protein [Pseudooceanicola sp. C21-150M6]|uniref:choice-of-anchor I family protein n=1 Tax=Pseudooceanicola sp. C21-150M6 TaxID=3434355 RepID=UPI003D7FB8D8